jgi:hypothetical protein
VYRISQPLLIILCITITSADSATQTDWSGGPGIWGPVGMWNNQFYHSSEVEWDGLPGDIVLQLIIKHEVGGDFGGARSVYSADLDGDGDNDILGGSFHTHTASWWENLDGTGSSWTEHIVYDQGDACLSVYSEDINADGDMDFLCATDCPLYPRGEITWYENEDGLGTSWIEHLVDGEFVGASSVYSEDLDDDGDMDILGAASNDNEITWWENVDGTGTIWTEHVIDGSFAGASSVCAEDVDDDGDMDVLGAADWDDDISWWENLDGTGTSWAEHTVEADFAGATAVYSADLNSDGDMDILGAAWKSNEISWWENMDGSGTSWTEHVVDVNFDGAWSVYSEDIDDDNDMDILGAAWLSDEITWWENNDGAGTSWTEHIVDGSFRGARSVYSEDVDGDGCMDIIGAAYSDDEIAWWDYSSTGELESSILYLGNDPGWGAIDWGSSTPPGTSVSFLVRSSDDIDNMGVWSDTLTAPCSLTGILNENESYFQYKVLLETSDPVSTVSLQDVTIYWDPAGTGSAEEPSVPSILPFSPNPASAPVMRFCLPEPYSVDISVFDLSGRLVSEIRGEEYSAGYHDVLLENISPGIYLCRMISGDFTAMQRFVVIE